MTWSKGVFVRHKKWDEYFFASLDGQGQIAVHGPLSVEELKKHLELFTVPKRVLDEDLLQVLSFLAIIIS